MGIIGETGPLSISRLFVRKHCEAKRSSRASHAMVEAQDRQVIGDLSCAERAGKVYGIERSDAITGERLSGPIDDRRADAKQCPVAGGGFQRAPASRELGFSQTENGARPNQRAGALDQREVRRQDLVGVGERDSHRLAARLAQKPGKDGARFSVEIQRPARSSSRRRLAVPGGAIRRNRG